MHQRFFVYFSLPLYDIEVSQHLYPIIKQKLCNEMSESPFVPIRNTKNIIYALNLVIWYSPDCKVTFWFQLVPPNIKNKVRSHPPFKLNILMLQRAKMCMSEFWIYAKHMYDICSLNCFSTWPDCWIKQNQIINCFVWIILFWKNN